MLCFHLWFEKTLKGVVRYISEGDIMKEPKKPRKPIKPKEPENFLNDFLAFPLFELFEEESSINAIEISHKIVDIFTNMLEGIEATSVDWDSLRIIKQNRYYEASYNVEARLEYKYKNKNYDNDVKKYKKKIGKYKEKEKEYNKKLKEYKKEQKIYEKYLEEKEFKKVEKEYKNMLKERRKTKGQRLH